MDMEVSRETVFTWAWWYWHVQVPGFLCDTLMVLGDEIPLSEVYKYLMPYDYIRAIVRTGKERPYASSRSYVTTEAAVLKGDPLLMLQCLEDMDLLLQPAEGNGGVLKDYSYLEHDVFSMEGMYGTSVLIHRLMKTASVLAGTKFEVNSQEVYNQFLWMEHTFRPVIHNGVLFAGTCGRGPSQGMMRGRSVITGALYLLGSFGEEEDRVLKTLIRKNVKKENLADVIIGIGNIAMAQRMRLDLDEN